MTMHVIILEKFRISIRSTVLLVRQDHHKMKYVLVKEWYVVLFIIGYELQCNSTIGF